VPASHAAALRLLLTHSAGNVITTQGVLEVFGDTDPWFNLKKPALMKKILAHELVRLVKFRFRCCTLFNVFL
jgi:hypothetical protein